MKKWFAICPHCSATVKGQVMELLGGRWIFAGSCPMCKGKDKNVRIVADDLEDLQKKHVWSE